MAEVCVLRGRQCWQKQMRSARVTVKRRAAEILEVEHAELSI